MVEMSEMGERGERSESIVRKVGWVKGCMKLLMHFDTKC